MKKLILGGFLMATLLLVGTLFVIGRKRGATLVPDSTVEASSTALGSSSDPGIAADWKGPLPAEIAKRFVNAKTHSERLKFLRNPDRNAELMEAFFRVGPGAEETVLDIAYAGPINLETVVLEGFRVELDNGTTRMLGVVLTPDGGLVDFRSYARYGSKSWADLLEGTAKEAEEVRLFMKPAFNFFGSYSDESIWLNYVASSPDLEEPLYCYAKQGSKVAESLGRISSSGQLVTLAIRSVGDDHQRRQFEVTDVLSLDWVMPETPSGIQPPHSTKP